MNAEENVQRNCTAAQGNAPKAKENGQIRAFGQQPADPQTAKRHKKRKKGGSTNQMLRNQLADMRLLLAEYKQQCDNLQRENDAVAAVVDEWKTTAEAREKTINTQREMIAGQKEKQGGAIAQAVESEMQVCRKLNELAAACRTYTNKECAGLDTKEIREFYDRHFLPHIAGLHREIMRFTGGKVTDALLFG